ncbi:MAG: hypothetical protein L3J31_01825 [Bacteroidales bacterium]|nr:hypothetical protein [Bacteroidales bacterium]MCF6341530.1 hypothetical protein [Bacteroidales bacterium]
MAILEFGSYYHIFNRGIDSAKIFNQKEDYEHFLELYKKYIPLIADTYAWTLMNNHFHFLVRIKDENEIGFLVHLTGSNKIEKWKVVFSEEASPLDIVGNKLKKPNPSRQFSHLFNAYSKWFNNKYHRTGGLFEKGFRRKEVENEHYLTHLVYYIHHNPLHHGIVKKYTSYQWTSYLDFIEGQSTIIDVKKVIDWFDDLGNFVFFHQEEHEFSLIDDLLID